VRVTGWGAFVFVNLGAPAPELVGGLGDIPAIPAEIAHADFDIDSMQQSIAFSDEVQREDLKICNAVQRNLHSRAYNQGRFSVKRENGVHHFQRLMAEFLQSTR
jgi:hypothetical protein